jgi:N-hydroxyarylamine O-acetyltransferase
MQLISHKDFHPDLGKLFKKLQLHDYDEKTFYPTLEFLQTIHKRFLLTFPFENLNLFIKDVAITDPNKCKIDIHPTQIEKKLLDDQRGGYCYEVNQYFFYVVRALGYHVTPLSARVVWMTPPDHQAYRNHVTMIVTFPPAGAETTAKEYLCDVAFGPPGFVSPLAIHESMLGEPQSTEYDTHRVIPFEPSFHEVDEKHPEYPNPNLMNNNSANHYMVQCLTDSGAWESLYFFHKKEIATFADWYCGNWSIATRPDSIMVNNIYISIVREDGKYTLFNDKFLCRKINREHQQEEGGSGGKRAVGFNSEHVTKPPATNTDATSPCDEYVSKKKIETREEYFQLLKKVYGYPVDYEYASWFEKLTIPMMDVVHEGTLPL